MGGLFSERWAIWAWRDGYILDSGVRRSCRRHRFVPHQVPGFTHSNRAPVSGALDILVSDHSPHAVVDKNLGLKDIRRSPSGEPGLEMLGRYFMDQVLRGKFPMARVLDGLSINPATRFGVASRKGHLKPGADADMVVFDPEGEFTVNKGSLFTKSRDSAGMWHGMQFRGNIDSTWVRGTEVVVDGAIVGQAGYGRMIRPEYSAESRAPPGVTPAGGARHGVPPGFGCLAKRTPPDHCSFEGRIVADPRLFDSMSEVLFRDEGRRSRE